MPPAEGGATIQVPISLENSPVGSIAADLHYDILLLIFQEFDLGLLIGRTDCAQCALVCRAWSDPASKVLWRTFWYSTIPLCHILLPLPNASEAYNNPGESGLTEYYDKIIAERPWTAPNVWERFLHCAARVREISMWTPNPSEAKLLDVLLEYNGGTTFLPSLLSLGWTQTASREARDVVCALVPSSLQTMNYEVAVDVPEDEVSSALNRLAAKAPHLASLTAPNSHGETSLIPSMTAFASLRSLYCYGPRPLTPADFKTFAATPLSTLESLLCRVDGFAGCPPSETFSAPKLRHMRVHGVKRSALSGFFPHLRAPRLEDVEIDITEMGGDYSAFGNADLLKEVADAAFAPSLRGIKFHTRPRHRAYGNVPSAPIGDVVKPLLALPDLRRVDIKYDWLSSLTDEAVLNLARAWPRLEELHLALTNYRGPFPTHAAFSHLAQHCPKLVQLSLKTPLNIEGGVSLVVPENTSGAGHPLRALRFNVRLWDTEGIPPKDLARHLHALFPNLVLDQGNLDDFPPLVRLRDPWERLWDELRTLQQSH